MTRHSLDEQSIRPDAGDEPLRRDVDGPDAGNKAVLPSGSESPVRSDAGGSGAGEGSVRPSGGESPVPLTGESPVRPDVGEAPVRRHGGGSGLEKTTVRSDSEESAASDLDGVAGGLGHEGASAASVGLLRVWVFSIWLVEVAFDPIERLARLPVTYFDPPSPLGLLPRDLLERLLTVEVLLAFRLALVAGLGVVVVGAYRRRWVPGAVVAGLVVHQVLVRSFTSVSHNEVAVLYVAALLCFFPLTDGLALRRPRRAVERTEREYEAAFLLAGLVLTLTYFATAVARMWKGLDLFTTSTLQDLVALHAVDGQGIFGLGRGVPEMLLRVVPADGWKLVYVAATLLELAFPLVLVSRAARWTLVPAMIAFHLASWLLLGVQFVENVLLMVVLSTVTFHRVAAALDGRRTGVRLVGDSGRARRGRGQP